VVSLRDLFLRPFLLSDVMVSDDNVDVDVDADADVAEMPLR